jgi:glycosyltransferase involved in cell wall biosynthesis
MVVPRFHPSVVGGAELHARWLAERLWGAGHEVEVFTTCALDSQTWDNTLPAGSERMDALLVHRFPVDPQNPEARLALDRFIRSGQRVTLLDEERWLRSGVCSRAMERALRERGPDFDAVLALPYLAGTTYFAFRAVPDRFCLIPCLHDEPFARCTFTRRMLSESRGLLFNTVPEQKLASSIASGLAPSAVVGLGFDVPPKIDAEAFARKYGVTRRFAVFVGRLELDKNVPLLIRYFLRYKRLHGGDLVLLLVGDGDVAVPESPDVQKMTIDWSDRDAMLRAASVLFQPSLKESLSIVMMQAWASGLPVMVDGGSAVSRYHCQQSNGGLWFDNYLEFDEALQRLEAQPHLRAGMGTNGREYVRGQYSWTVVLERFHQAMQDLCAEPADQMAQVGAESPN